MSEEVSKASGDLSTNPEGKTEILEDENSVSYSSYTKVLAERKRDRERARQAEAQLAEIQSKLLVAEGKKDEVIESYKKRYEETEATLREERLKMVSDKVSTQIRTAANDHGCVNVDKYLKLIGDEELSSIKEKVDENYNIDKQALDELIKRSKKEHEDINLFRKTDVKVHDVTSSYVPKNKKKSVDDMTVDELRELILKK